VKFDQTDVDRAGQVLLVGRIGDRALVCVVSRSHQSVYYYWVPCGHWRTWSAKWVKASDRNYVILSGIVTISNVLEQCAHAYCLNQSIALVAGIHIRGDHLKQFTATLADMYLEYSP